MSVNAVSFSAPMTSARWAAPQRIDMSASARAWTKPEQATLTSMTAAPGVPMAVETMPATFGERCSAVVLATTTRSMVAASRPPLVEGVLGGLERHVGHRLVGSGVTAGDDPGPRADPLVGRLDDRGELVVGDDAGRLEVADGDRLRAARSVPRDHRGTVVLVDDRVAYAQPP